MKKIEINPKNLNLAAIQNQKISIIGYGIQGRAQALNLRDSGIEPYIGNIDDKYLKDAVSDNMRVSDISQATKNADIIMMLVPDQSQSDVLRKFKLEVPRMTA